jgi:hypothetical protein
MSHLPPSCTTISCTFKGSFRKWTTVFQSKIKWVCSRRTSSSRCNLIYRTHALTHKERWRIKCFVLFEVAALLYTRHVAATRPQPACYSKTGQCQLKCEALQLFECSSFFLLFGLCELCSNKPKYLRYTMVQGVSQTINPSMYHCNVTLNR